MTMVGMRMSAADCSMRAAFSLREERRFGARLAWRIARLFPAGPPAAFFRDQAMRPSPPSHGH